ncbi:MAG: hypothetical protein V4550_10175 [Gemmatimonadota bacterium]
MAQRTVADVARVTRQSHWREDEARHVIEGWRRSGESRLRFAARHGIDPKHLRRWIVRLAGRFACRRGFAAADSARVLAVVEAAPRPGPHGERSPSGSAG